MSERYFRINSGAQTFYANIENTEKNRWTISVGGVRKGCVLLRVTNIERQWRGDLDMVAYDVKCNVNGDMPRGGATVALIRCAMMMAFKEFPDLHNIFLLDQSRVECTDSDFYLPPLMLAVYGKTWYEKNINAQLAIKELYEYIEIYTTHVLRPLPKFNDFWKTIELYIHRDYKTTVSNGLSAIWNQHATLRVLLTNLKTDNKCELFALWLQDYFEHIMHAPFKLEKIEYVVRRETSNWTVSIEELRQMPGNRALKNRSREQLDLFSTFMHRTSASGGAGPLYGRLTRNNIADLSYL